MLTLNADKLKALAAKYGDKVVQIALNPAEHGFSFGTGPLHKKGMELTKNAPFIVHEDVNKMSETFGPEYFLDCANGQSGRVRDQTLREDIYDEKALSSRPEEMACIIVQRALGAKRARKVTVITKESFVTYIDGQRYEFETEAELQAAVQEAQQA